MRLTPFMVVRSQLLTAIELFFADKEPISVQALAGNARELLEELCCQIGVEPVTELLLRGHYGQLREDIYDAMNVFRSCFKYLGTTESKKREDQAALDQFDDSINDYLLYVCVEDYVRLRKAMPIPMQVFHNWFRALHSDLPGAHDPTEKINDFFENVQQMSRPEQKRAAAAAIFRLTRASSFNNQSFAKKRRHRVPLSDPELQANVDFGWERRSTLAYDLSANADRPGERRPLWNNDLRTIIDGSWERCERWASCSRRNAE